MRFAVLFTAEDGDDRELYITDGTAAGTGQVANIGVSDISGAPGAFAQLPDGRVLFNASEGAERGQTGRELYLLDTALNVSLVADLAPGEASSSPEEFTALPDGRAVFVAGVLWVTDGTADGTTRLLGPANGPFPAAPANLTPLPDGRIVFVTRDDTPLSQLWVTDGTASGTRPIADVGPFVINELVPLPDGRLLFIGADTNGRELWVTDGTASGTTRFLDLNPGGADSEASDFARLGDGRVVFSADSGASAGSEPWVTDGTAAGTFALGDLNPGLAGSGLRPLAATLDGRVLFAAEDAAGTALWITDGTSGGTVLVRRLDFELLGRGPIDAAVLGDGRVTFTVADPAGGFAIYATDGTAAGTTLVRAFDDRPFSLLGGRAFDYTALGDGRVVFAITDSTEPEGVWITDGTAAGTVQLGAFKDSGNFYLIRLPDPNLPPEIVAPIRDRAGTEGRPITFTVAPETFSDPDGSGALTLAAGLAQGGGLPAWLAFDPTTGRFSGTPGPDDAGPLRLRVTATDADGASVSDDFVLRIGDRVAGRFTDDALVGSPTNDALLGRTGNDTLTGSGGRDYLAGGFGDDVLIGGLGADRLHGNAGADRFRYASLQEGGDIVFGFDPGLDGIEIVAAGFGGGLVAGADPTPNFVIGGAPTADVGQFLYAGGALLWDADGTGPGAARRLATLDDAPPLTAADLVLI